MKVGDLVKVKPPIYQMGGESYDSVVGIVTNMVDDPYDGKSYIDIAGPFGLQRWPENNCWVLNSESESESR